MELWENSFIYFRFFGRIFPWMELVSLVPLNGQEKLIIPYAYRMRRKYVNSRYLTIYSIS